MNLFYVFPGNLTKGDTSMGLGAENLHGVDVGGTYCGAKLNPVAVP